MATTISFPSSPSHGQEYTYGSTTYVYSSTSSTWSVVSVSPVTFETLDAAGDVGTGANQLAEGNDSRFSDNRTPVDSSVSWDKLHTSLKNKVAVAASDIDWSAGNSFYKTISADLTLTFSNLQEGKTIAFTLTGDYVLTLPTYVDVISGEYDGAVANLIIFYCEEDASGSEVVWCSIDQKAV